MSIHVNSSGDNDKQVPIKVTGRFEYAVHKEFRAAYIDHAKSHTEFKVDLSKTEYMDSSALGMLLLLKEHADAHQGKVSIHNAHPNVQKVLEIAHFDRIFSIFSSH